MLEYYVNEIEHQSGLDNSRPQPLLYIAISVIHLDIIYKAQQKDKQPDLETRTGNMW